MIMASSSSNRRSSNRGSSSRTVTFEVQQQPIIQDNRLQGEETLTLHLAPRLKKKVSWKEGTVDNEFLQRKSSKECCIFHEQQQHDDDDSSDDELPCKLD
ncbi:unnamed protein product [Calypogeia fissa]